jgi:alanyl-tRNA synthetase
LPFIQRNLHSPFSILPSLFRRTSLPFIQFRKLDTAFPFQVDVPGFEAEMAAQRARSKDSREEIDLTSRGLLSALATSLGYVAYRSFLQYFSG